MCVCFLTDNLHVGQKTGLLKLAAIDEKIAQPWHSNVDLNNGHSELFSS